MGGNRRGARKGVSVTSEVHRREKKLRRGREGEARDQEVRAKDKKLSESSSQSSVGRGSDALGRVGEQIMSACADEGKTCEINTGGVVIRPRSVSATAAPPPAGLSIDQGRSGEDVLTSKISRSTGASESVGVEEASEGNGGGTADNGDSGMRGLCDDAVLFLLGAGGKRAGVAEAAGSSDVTGKRSRRTEADSLAVDEDPSILGGKEEIRGGKKSNYCKTNKGNWWECPKDLGSTQSQSVEGNCGAATGAAKGLSPFLAALAGGKGSQQ